jgi:uncharacterized membrane protein
MVFFSDAVFAIVITLLVLPLTTEADLPEQARSVPDAVLDRWPAVMTFAISFLVIGQFWVAHHRLFEKVRGVDTGLLWANLLFLLTISFMPFPSAVLGATTLEEDTFAVTFYAVSMSLASAALTGTWLYVLRRDLVRPDVGADERSAVTRRALTTTAVFTASVPVSFLGLAPAVLLWLGVLPAARALLGRPRGRVGSAAPV